MGPLTVSKPEPVGFGPPFGTRPWDVLMPLKPHKAAGIRIEPPPSLPVAKGTMPAASAAEDPPEEPPGVRVKSQGFLVTPNGTLSVLPL